MIKTVIFDLDGTLIDTEKYFKVFWRKAAEAFGFDMSEKQALELRSLGKPFAAPLLQTWFGEGFDYLAVRDKRRQLMKEYLDEVGLELKPGAKEALTWLKQNHYRVALATATPVDRAAKHLRETGIYEYFDMIVSAAQVERGKPAPDVYLYACEQLGEQPEDCIAVEDSPNGVNSAHAAGLQVVMVPDQTEPDEDLKGKLYACIASLEDLPGVLEGGCMGFLP
ncbi:MAG: HAD family phosphatase [Lachnospiraceae bacterium]|nr:HAD family phosphatase [Lachnospiraceae bacterium]